jgi:hypothetical protein
MAATRADVIVLFPIFANQQLAAVWAFHRQIIWQRPRTDRDGRDCLRVIAVLAIYRQRRL